jgi:hypothetical protein
MFSAPGFARSSRAGRPISSFAADERKPREAKADQEPRAGLRIDRHFDDCVVGLKDLAARKDDALTCVARPCDFAFDPSCNGLCAGSRLLVPARQRDLQFASSLPESRPETRPLCYFLKQGPGPERLRLTLNSFAREGVSETTPRPMPVWPSDTCEWVSVSGTLLFAQPALLFASPIHPVS